MADDTMTEAARLIHTTVSALAETNKTMARATETMAQVGAAASLVAAELKGHMTLDDMRERNVTAALTQMAAAIKDQAINAERSATSASEGRRALYARIEAEAKARQEEREADRLAHIAEREADRQRRRGDLRWIIATMIATLTLAVTVVGIINSNP